MKKILFISTLITSVASAQEIKDLTYDAYLSGIINIWERSIQTASDKYDISRSNEDLFELALAEYGLLNATMKDQNEEAFDKYADRAIEHFEELLENGHRPADCKAVMSAVYGLKIAYSPWKGMFLGPKSASYIEEALADNPNSPIVWKLRGNHQMFTPETWGGDVQNAEEAYVKAIDIFKESGDTRNFLFLDIYPWLGQAYAKQDKFDKAKETYQEALEYEPEFYWVKFGLLPSVNKEVK